MLQLLVSSYYETLQLAYPDIFATTGGGEGHISRDCPEPRAERSGGGGGYGNRSCYNCGEAG